MENVTAEQIEVLKSEGKKIINTIYSFMVRRTL